MVRESALGPIRDITDIRNISLSQVRPISKQDFLDSLLQIKPSVILIIKRYLLMIWNHMKFGIANSEVRAYEQNKRK